MLAGGNGMCLQKVLEGCEGKGSVTSVKFGECKYEVELKAQFVVVSGIGIFQCLVLIQLLQIRVCIRRNSWATHGEF